VHPACTRPCAAGGDAAVYQLVDRLNAISTGAGAEGGSTRGAEHGWVLVTLRLSRGWFA
jgi:hypothetical protein